LINVKFQRLYWSFLPLLSILIQLAFQLTEFLKQVIKSKCLVLTLQNFLNVVCDLRMNIKCLCILVELIFININLHFLKRIKCLSLGSKDKKSSQNKTELIVVKVATSVFKVNQLKRGGIRDLHSRM
jgi:hypothetical protein